MPGNVDIITNNLNEIISTKNEFKQIIQENGLTAGTVFSEYPNKIRSLIGSGSMSGDTVNSYISAYLDSYNFIDQDELSANSYVTSDVLSSQSYATTTDLSNHLPYLGTLQAHYTNSEHFLPKSNNTYYLGNRNFQWQLVYTYNVYTSNLYADITYISNSTYLPVNTYWYDGTTYHWLGSLFN